MFQRVKKKEVYNQINTNTKGGNIPEKIDNKIQTWLETSQTLLIKNSYLIYCLTNYNGFMRLT